MRLEDYWGIGPKTAALLERELGVEASIDAIESADVRTLVDAGLSSGRATRILRRSIGGAGVDVLTTADTRAVYRDLIGTIRTFAVTQRADDRIRVLTPMLDRGAIEARLDEVESARDTWEALSEADRTAVLNAFAVYDEAGGGERAAVRAALTIAELGVDGGAFEPLATLPTDELADAGAALAHLDGEHVRAGADDRLDEVRTARAAVESMNANALDALESIRAGDVRGTDEFRESYVEYVVAETGVDASRVRETFPDEATDAADFVGQALRSLLTALRADERERADEIAAELGERVEGARADVDAAVDAVERLAFLCSLARFAAAFDLTRPTLTERETVAVVGARNLSLVERGETITPVTYAIGEHDIEGSIVPPQGHRVTVLTGANSGGKTTLLETICQIVLLAAMGLPVPAERAETAVFESLVFHRRHASFNAGVLESTLRTIVPPLADGRRTLMLVDEFEAITEPGSAADLLHGLVRLTVDRGAMGAFVTHLAEDLSPLPPEARVDGIFAEGLSAELELLVDYQPRFETIGRSTPEFIVSRLVASATDRAERAGYETLAVAVGQEAVQRTLADAEWSGVE